ncbi:MAG: DNA polymerase III subunit delta [Clostridia bacterium]|nr:DNA polymerase III subunit delta [Clostridia bacterium]
MDIATLKTRIKGGTLAGVYVLCGEENFLKRYYMGEIRTAILTDPTFDAFNRIVLEGEKIDYGALSEAVQAPPMMAERKLVEWHLADFSSLKEGDIEKLKTLADEVKQYPETVVVFFLDADRFDVGNLPKRPSKQYAALSAFLSIVVFERSGEAALAQWIGRHFTHEGVSASPAVIRALLETSGTSMDTLAGEIAKLSAYVLANGRQEVTLEDVAFVASRVTESDAFGLSNAILSGDAAAAYACLADMRRRKVEPTLAIAAVSRTYADLLTVAAFRESGVPQKEIAAHLKMHEFKVGLYLRAAARRSMAQLEEANALCRRADTASKTGAGLGGYLALEYLIARTLPRAEG